MIKIVVIAILLIFTGTGCLETQSAEVELADGYSRYNKNELSFVYPSDLTINEYNFDTSNFDWESNIFTAHTTVDELESYCWNEFGYRYADNPSERPIAEGLAILAENGLSHTTSRNIPNNVWDCGWAWGSYEQFPLNVGEYKGVVDYGCAGDSGACTPEVNWVNVTLVNYAGNVHLISFRPIFGNLKDRDLMMFVDTDEDWDLVASATHAALTNGFFYREDPAISWFGDLVANIETIDQIISTIRIGQ